MDTSKLFPNGSNYVVNGYTNVESGRYYKSYGYPDGYYLGYIGSDKVPWAKATKSYIEKNGSNDPLDWDIVCEPQADANVMIGFSMGYEVPYVAHMWTDNGVFNYYNTSSSNLFFWNKFYPEFFRVPSRFVCYFTVIIYNTLGEILNVSQKIEYYWGSYSSYRQCVKGIYKLTFTHQDTSVQFSLADFETGTMFVEQGNYQFRFFLVGCRFYGSDGSINNVTPQIIAKMSGSYEDGSDWTCCCITSGFETTAICRIYYSSTVEVDSYYFELDGNYKRVPGGIRKKISIPWSAIETGRIAGYNDEVYYISSTYGTRYIYVYPYYRLSDVETFHNLMWRFTLTGAVTPYSYIDGETFATYVTPNNEFTGTLITGDRVDSTFIAKLRPWQYTNPELDPSEDPGSQANDFTEEDAPPYEPPSPDPEPGDQDDKDVDPEEDPGEIPDNEGEYQDDNRSWTITSPNNFITQYILSADQVSALGSTLWSSWLSENTDIWKNFMFSLDVAKDTGTFNISSVLNLIISLRVFPFDILNVVAQGGFKYSNGLYMGAGHTNFMPDSYIPTVTSIINSISCGTCVVKPSDGSAYDDFRDIYNTSVCAFLPYCGTVELNPADVMFKTLECVYYVEWQSGGCTAVIILHDGNAKYTVASKSGQLGFMLPITATNAGQVTGQFVSDAIHAASLIGNNIFSQTNAVGKSIIGALQGGAGGGLESNAISTSMGIARGNFNTALSLAGEANDMMARSGIGIPMLSGGTGMTSMMFPSKPYVQIRRGKYKVPKKYGHNVGYRSSTYQRVGSYTGFTVFSGVDVSGLDCTEEEQMKIKAIMESGIYVTNDK